MYRLPSELTAALGAGATVLVPSRQRAAAVRLAHAAQQLRAGRRVWNSPDVITWDAWLSRELLRARQASGDGPVWLNRSQELELWRAVLETLAQDEEELRLFSRHAESLAEAARLAREWRLRWPVAGATEEAALLARALTLMDEACRERGVAVVSLVQDDALTPLAPSALTFAGVTKLTPRQARVAQAFANAGRTVGIAGVEASSATPQAFSYGSAVDEAAAIARWCRERLEADATTRLLVVSADARVDATRLLETIEGAVGDAAALEGGVPLVDQPVVVAALAVLELSEDEIAFETLSTVLLSPHLAAGGSGLRLELALRKRLPDRCETSVVLEELGRCDEPLQVSAAALAEVIRQARDTLSVRQTLGPLEWARRFTELLERAGHGKGRKLASQELQAWQRWQATLEEFASLGAVAPSMTAQTATGRLRALLRRSEHRAASGDAPVTVTSSLGDPIVGYDGIWVAGLAETRWPEAPRLDPFLPAALQREAGLPGASASLRLAEAQAQRRAWQTAAGGELRLSHARADGDIDQAPSVLLHDLAISAQDAPRRAGVIVGQGEARPVEPALPPRDRSAPFSRAGARLPELQRDCPFRAQAELRLGAEELASPRVGIDARLRGLLVHRAMENLWKVVRTGERLRSRPPESWQPEIAAAVDAAFEGSQTTFGAPPTARQQNRERERCRVLLLEALTLESQRGVDYTVIGSESKPVWHVAGTRLSLRIDRLDRLADGSQVIVDYKTGASAKLDLLSDAPRPVQLMAYLDAVGGDVSALALMRLVPGITAIDGLEDGRAGLPKARKRGGPPPIEDWPAQLAAWRGDVQDPGGAASRRRCTRAAAEERLRSLPAARAVPRGHPRVARVPGRCGRVGRRHRGDDRRNERCPTRPSRVRSNATSRRAKPRSMLRARSCCRRRPDPARRKC